MWGDDREARQGIFTGISKHIFTDTFRKTKGVSSAIFYLSLPSMQRKIKCRDYLNVMYLGSELFWPIYSSLK